MFRINGLGMDISKDFEFISTANIIAIAGNTIGNHFLTIGVRLANLPSLKRFNPAMFL
jgi:hypothetical protein